MTASLEILAGLQAANLPVEKKGLLAAISNREGDSARQLYSYGKLVRPDPQVHDAPGNRIWLGSLSRFPPWPGAYIPKDPYNRLSTAAGGWQFIGTTYAGIASLTGLHDFSLASQIMNADRLADRDFTVRSKLDLLTTLKAGKLALVAEYLYATWPGGAASDLPTRYASNLALFTQPAFALASN